jgi:hypothetical protein
MLLAEGHGFDSLRKYAIWRKTRVLTPHAKPIESARPSQATEKLFALTAVTDFLPGFDLSRCHAWRRSKAGGDVQLFNPGAADFSQPPGAISQQLLESVLIEAREHELLSEEHFTVDGTLIQAWAPTRSIGKRSLSRRCAPAKWRRTSANM